MYHNEPVINTDENAPATIPTINGNVNSLIEDTPIMNITNTEINVVNEV